MRPILKIYLFPLFLLFIICIAPPNFAQDKITANLSITPQPAFMGKIPISSSADRQILIYNQSIETINISSITITGPDASEFLIQDNPGSTSLGAIEKLTLIITYTPTKAGETLGILEIQSDAGTFTDSLQGEGIQEGSVITFERIFGTQEDEGGGSIWTVNDGGYILTGSTTLPDAKYPDIYVARTDVFGKILWTKTYGGNYEDGGTAVIQTSDGNFVVLASSNSYGSGQSVIYLFKVDSSGNKIWEQVISENKDISPSSLRETSDGGLIISGNTKDTPDNSSDALLVKTDGQGNVQWKKHYGGSDGESASGVLPTSDGGYIFSGSIAYASNGDFDVYVVKTDASGNEQWSKTYGGSNWDVANSIRKTSDGGYILAGHTVSYGAGGEDGYLIKIDVSGNQEWFKFFGYDHNDNFSSAVQTPDGGFLACGSTVSFFTQTIIYTDIYLVKTDSSGNMVWSKKFGGDKSENGGILPALDGGYIISGTTASYGQSIDFLLIKINVDGSITAVPRNNGGTISNNFLLQQNYPNPFNPSTIIQYSIKKSGPVTLTVFNMLGKKVATLVNKYQSTGTYSVSFKAFGLASGIYFYRCQSGASVSVKKMILMK